jgi:hypothetical protein
LFSTVTSSIKVSISATKTVFVSISVGGTSVSILVESFSVHDEIGMKTSKVNIKQNLLKDFKGVELDFFIVVIVLDLIISKYNKRIV